MCCFKVCLYAFFVFCLYPLTNAGGICRGKATCQGLRECAPVKSLIESLHKPLKPSVVQFLKAQQCGFADGYPRICCGVLPKNLRIFNKHKPSYKPSRKRYQAQEQKQEHQVKLNRAPAIESTINKLSIYQPEPANFMNPPHFDITVSTAPPGASTVPYLRNLQRDESKTTDNGFTGGRPEFQDAISQYMQHYDLQRTRRSGVDNNNLDIEVR